MVQLLRKCSIPAQHYCEALQQCPPVASVSSLGAAGGLTSGVEQQAPIQQYPLQYPPAACVAAAAAAGQLQHSRCRRASLTPAQNTTDAAAKRLNCLAAPCSVTLPARLDQKAELLDLDSVCHLGTPV